MSRAKREYDGDGAIESLDTASPLDIYADPTINQNTGEMTTDQKADIRVGDVVEVPYSLIQRGD
jgi:hypothetical protein